MRQSFFLIAQYEIVLGAVQNYPILYDKTLKDYSNSSLKNMVWQRIAIEIGL